MPLLAAQVNVSCGLRYYDDAVRAVDLVVLALQPYRACGLGPPDDVVMPLFAGQVTIARGLGSPDDAARAVDLVVLALQPYSTDLAEQLAVLHGSLSARSCQK